MAEAEFAELGYSSTVRPSRIHFAVLLPILELTLWAVLVPTQTAYVYFRLAQLSRGSSTVELGNESYQFSIPRDRLLIWSLNSVGTRESHTVTAINMPGMFGEVLVSLPTTWPSSWHPQGWPLDAWRALAFPFLALPAWWFAGRGLDSLLRWRRPRWWTLLAGSLLCAGFLTLLCGFRFGMSAEERLGSNWILWGCAFWAVVFATFPAAWICNLRSRPARALTSTP